MKFEITPLKLKYIREKPTREPRYERVGFQVNKAEKEMLKNRAKEAHKPLADYMRDAVLSYEQRNCFHSSRTIGTLNLFKRGNKHL